MEKKRIAFVIKNLKMGGTRVSLISLTEAIATTDQFDIDLIVMNHTGPLMERIPEGVRLLPEDQFLKIAVADKYDLNLFYKIIRGILYLIKKVFGYHRAYKKIYKIYAKHHISSPYDLVIGYQEGESNDFAVMIPAKKHMIWYHSNYRVYYKYEKGIRLPELFDLADKIAFVSAESFNCFINDNPRYQSKCCVIRNIIPIQRIKESACKDVETIYHKNVFRIVSVGRLSPEKGFERAIRVSEQLRAEGYRFEWVVVGNGKEYEKLIREVNEKNLGDFIRFIGERKNPYQIVNQADLFVLPSYSEAQPLVVLEGIVLGKPFISTDFDSAREVLDPNCGFIVENSEEGIYNCLKPILQDNSILEKKKKYIANYRFSNDDVIQRIFSVTQ